MNMGWLSGATRAAVAVAVVLGSTAPGADAQERFTLSADGAEVTDTRTGLVWRRCSAGQTYSGGTCTGDASTFRHEGALAYAAGQPGWRLPNVKELSTIVDVGRVSPAIDTVAFPGTPSSGFWTSSPLAGFPDLAWFVFFDYGNVSYDFRSFPSHVRLVR